MSHFVQFTDTRGDLYVFNKSHIISVTMTVSSLGNSYTVYVNDKDSTILHLDEEEYSSLTSELMQD